MNSHAQQAVGRVYRIGQRKRTNVYRLYTYGTWEDVLIQNNLLKESLFNLVIDSKETPNQAGKNESKRHFKLPPDEPKKFVQDSNEISHPILTHVIEKCIDKLSTIIEKASTREDQELIESQIKISFENNVNVDKGASKSSNKFIYSTNHLLGISYFIYFEFN